MRCMLEDFLYRRHEMKMGVDVIREIQGVKS